MKVDLQMVNKNSFSVPYMVTFREYSEVVYAKQSRIMINIPVYASLSALAIYAASYHWIFFVLAVAPFALLLIFVLGLVVFVFAYRRAYAPYAKDAKICRIYLDERSIELYRGLEKTSINWGSIVGISESPTLLFLKINLLQGIAVRKSALGDQLADLRNLIREKGIRNE